MPIMAASEQGKDFVCWRRRGRVLGRSAHMDFISEWLFVDVTFRTKIISSERACRMPPFLYEQDFWGLYPGSVAERERILEGIATLSPN